MNNLPDDDPQLTSFLKQYRPLSPPANQEDLEHQLMTEIALLPIDQKPIVSRLIAGTIGILTVGTIGMIIHQWLRPPELSITELHQLDRFLIERSGSFTKEPAATENTASGESDDLEAFLLQFADEHF